MEYTDELYHYGRKGMKWGEDIYAEDEQSKRYSTFTDEDRKRGQDVRLKQKGQRVREQQKQERLEKQKREMLNKVMAEKQRREGYGSQDALNPPTSRPNYVTTEDMEDRNADLTAQKENLLSNVDEFKTLVAVKGDKSVDDYDSDMREKYANNIDYDKIKNNLEVTNKYSSNSLSDRDSYIEKELESLSKKLDGKLKELEKKYSIVRPPEDKDYEKKLKDIKLRFENIKADARINYERAFNDVVGPRKDPNKLSPVGFIKYTTNKNAEKKANKAQEQKDHETEVAENSTNPSIVLTPYAPIVIPKDRIKHSVIDAADKILANRAEQIGEDELYHHGILGMKWGVRRYQNEDGTLTPQGRKRYLTGEMVVDEHGNTMLVGDADKRRQDLEKWNYKDAKKALRSTNAYKMGNAVGIGSALVGGTIAQLGARKLMDPALSTYLTGGSVLAATLGFGLGNKLGKKEAGLDDEMMWLAKNNSKYNIDTSDLGADIKWMNVQDLAKLRNQQNYADNY